MISAGVEGRLPYMTYSEPWRGPPKQPPEFLRPPPKPLPTTRYNGVASQNPNGTRLVQPQRLTSKYPSPPAVAPVNLTQPKEDVREEMAYSTYPSYVTTQHFSPFHTNPYTTYPHSYPPMIRTTFGQPPPLSPLDTYSPTTPTPNSASTSYHTTPSAYSPPSKPGQSLLRDKRPPPLPPSFKVPSGKEGSKKHIILTRPEDAIDVTTRKRLNMITTTTAITPPSSSSSSSTSSSPHSPAKPLNNNTLSIHFAKGRLIQLDNGELKRIEDMRTEDFVLSAERNPELRLADSTVVKIDVNENFGTTIITLSYNQRRAQVELKSSLEYPYFVYGQGWASCSPERTLDIYGLRVHKLQVGDILVSLTPREKSTAAASAATSSTSITSTIIPSRTSTIITTATTTEMTVRPLSSSTTISKEQIIDHSNSNNNNNTTNQIFAPKSTLYGINLIKNNHTSNHLSNSIMNHLNNINSSHLSNSTSGHLSNLSASHLSNSTSGHLCNSTSGHLNNSTSSHLSNSTSSHLSNSISGHLSNSTSSHLNNLTLGHLSNSILNHLSNSTSSHLSNSTLSHLNNSTLSHLSNSTLSHLSNSTLNHLSSNSTLGHLSNPNTSHLSNVVTSSHLNNNNNVNTITRTISPDDSLGRKRRWSAPDQICDEDRHQTITSRLKKE